MLRSLVCSFVLCSSVLACGGNDRLPPIDLNPAPSGNGGAPDEGDGGSDGGGTKKPTIDLHEGGFIHLPQVSDILYDDLRDVLYVSTTQGGLATVDLDTGIISSQKIGDGPLTALDLSPSGDKLVIGENSADDEAMQYWIHVADFANSSLQEYYFSQFYDLQEGTHGAAFATDETIFLSSSFVASGYVPLIQLNLSDGSQEELPAVVSDAMFARSLDNSTLVIVEPKDGTGPVHVIDTETLVMADGIVNETLHDVAINADASVLAFPAKDLVKLRAKDSAGAYTIESSIDQSDRDARAAVFSPVSDSIYVTWSAKPDRTPAFVERYNAKTLESEGIVQSGIKLATERLGGYVPTRMKMSNDGRLLFITVETGINVIAVEP
jgi:hypothetical protein